MISGPLCCPHTNSLEYQGQCPNRRINSEEAIRSNVEGVRKLANPVGLCHGMKDDGSSMPQITGDEELQTAFWRHEIVRHHPFVSNYDKQSAYLGNKEMDPRGSLGSKSRGNNS